MNITLTDAEISLIDDSLAELSGIYIGQITDESQDDDEGWAWRRLLEIANVRNSINTQIERQRVRVEPDKAWENAINEVRKAWGDDE